MEPVFAALKPACGFESLLLGVKVSPLHLFECLLFAVALSSRVFEVDLGTVLEKAGKLIG